MEPAVADLCTQLAHSRLLPAEQVQALHQRWLAEAKGNPADLNRFRRWLVGRKYLTRYQAKLLFHGHADHCFLGPYKILDRLAKGRMAGVYKAVHESGHIVAAKVLPPSKALDPQALARFQREAQLAQRLKHPHVVRTFQTGESNGLHYLVMEYLAGETLRGVLRRRGKLPPAKAGRLIYQALLGLQHLHEQGLVHRDLEPGNLMLVPGRGNKRTISRAIVKLLDVGLARALDDAPTPDGNAVVSTEGDFLGTPTYMAPEQARDFHSADIRADIYSLGCILYHALTGRPPFPDNNILRQILRHSKEVPKTLKECGVEAPAGLQEVLDLMLAKEPAQRYATPQRAAEALEEVLAGKTDTLKPIAAPTPKLDAFLKWLESDSKDDIKIPEPPSPPPRKSQSVPVRPPAPPPAAAAVVAGQPADPTDLGGLLPRSGRDLFLFASGVVGVLLVESVVWLLFRMTRG